MKAPDAAELQSIATLLNGGQIEKAMSLTKRLIGKFPQAPTLQLMLGVGFAMQGKLDPAINSYKKALALNPDYVDALNNLGVAFRKKGDLTEAVHCYEKAHRLQPTNSDVLYNLAGLHEAQGRSQDAIDVYKKVVALVPNHLDALNNLGLAYYKDGRFREAAEPLTTASALRPTDLRILQNLALVFDAMGKVEDLTNVDTKLLALDPEHIVKLGSFACTERTSGRPVTAFLNRILRLAAERRGDVATAMWAALTLDLPEKAFSYTSPKLNTVPYGELSHFYRSPLLPARLEALPQIQGAWPEPGKNPVVFAAASGDYADIYAHDLIGSVLAKSADVDVHFHVMNPGDYDIAQASATFPHGRVTFTFEDIGPCEKTTYSTRRFLRLSQLVARTGRAFIAVDADSLFNGDVSVLQKELGEYDAAIYLRSDQPFVSQMISAGVLAVSPTPEGRAFIDFVAAYILHFENEGTSKWFVDQLALISAHTWFKENVPQAVIKPLPKPAIDWSDDYAPESLIWTQKGGNKSKIAAPGR